MRHDTTGYNTTQTHGMTVQYNAVHHNMAQHILLNPIPHGVFRITHTWGGQILPPPLVTQPF